MNRAALFGLRGIPFSEHYAQIGSSLLVAAGHVLYANKSQICPAIKTFHGEANKFLSKRHCASRER